MREHLKKYIDKSNTVHVRGLRILLEYFYATEIFEKISRNRVKVVSVFGSARTKPHSPEYKQTHQLGSRLYRLGYAVVTGASRGIMQAANQGVADEIARQIVRQRKSKNVREARKTPAYKKRLAQHSVGLSISLPHESGDNPFIGVGATFHYFMIRKFFFGTLSSAFVACEGGWGTRDELFEILTLVQTGKSPVMPIVYLSPDPRHLKRDIQHALKKKYISPEDLSLLKLVKTPQQAVKDIHQFYRCIDRIAYDRDQSVHLFFKKPLSASLKRKVEEILQRNEKKTWNFIWRGKELFLPLYAPKSYGRLRQAIDFVNRPK